MIKQHWFDCLLLAVAFFVVFVVIPNAIRKERTYWDDRSILTPFERHNSLR